MAVEDAANRGERSWRANTQETGCRPRCNVTISERLEMATIKTAETGRKTTRDDCLKIVYNPTWQMDEDLWICAYN